MLSCSQPAAPLSPGSESAVSVPDQQFSYLDDYCDYPQTCTPVSVKNEEETSPAATSLYVSSTQKTMLVLSWILGGKEGLF